MNKKTKIIWMIITFGIHSLLANTVFAEVSDFACGQLTSSYGPFDYRTDKDKLGIVESVHLTPDVLNLVRGATGEIGGDLNYTLRTFPNHHLALMSMVRLGEKQKQSIPRGARYSVECYLYRAVKFRPDDGMVKLIYANYLGRIGRSSEAIKYLQEIEELGEENANVYYNMGLIYLDVKDYEKALLYARRAYQLGFPLPGLRNRLEKIGKWKN